MKRTLRLTAFLLGMAAVACNGGHGSGGNHTRTIDGKLTTTRYGTSGQIIVSQSPRDLSKSAIAAWHLEHGAYKKYPGSGAADGSFAIANVPEDTVLVQVDEELIETQSSTIRNDEPLYGRPDAKTFAGSADRLAASATGMSAWSDDDMLMLDCLDVDAYWSTSAHFDGNNNPVPAAGDTSISNFIFTSGDNALGAGKMVEGKKGDRCTLLHQRATHTGNAILWTTADAAPVDPFDTLTDQATPIHGVFSPVAATETGTFDVDVAAFSALFPAGSQPSADISVNAQPRDPAQGWMVNISTIADLYGGLADLVKTPVQYGNPFAGWHETGLAFIYYDGAPKLPGTMNPASLSVAYWAIYRDAAAVLDAPLTPRITAVQAPQVNGQDLTTAQTGVTTAPTLSWKAPATGTATSYSVHFYHLRKSPDGQDTLLDHTLGLDVHGTSIQVPDGFLSAGEPYVVLISAYQGTDDLTAFYGLGPNPDVVSMDFLSAIITA